MQIQPGINVIVRAYPSVELTRRVVAVGAGFVVLTTDNEWKLARRENRDPISIAFPIDDILRIENSN